ncbi:putative spermidine/putrescine transport system ATP-binding protein [Rhizobium subbaraonis]|uniref:Putative spermidine/putrescine transport system ATP-binding protein n=1 Tax=Rhizobium subbaraonis TaxID=908946 RepID=A0A285UY74_9HYPH|nr:ABC transporter ATP-binding protein [Rhizobium subbaraonis]SOC45221.1 putative spermidine/putrescine transport system ATP-binding protein [Rhizobium subbaraonis]
MSAVLQLSNVVKTYGDLRALDGIELSLPEDSYVSLLGPSGSGKTTLLRVIAGFEQPESGAIRFSGKDVSNTPPHERNIGFVFQNFALFPHLSVYDNIAFGLVNRAVDPVTDMKLLDRKVRDMISLVGLAGLEGRATTQISGGQKQRVALARTLVTEPQMVLLDEPLGALDANLRARMRSELRMIRERCGVTFLHVTGSETEALAMGDTVLVLDRARIAQQGDSDTIYNRPCSPAVARFLNCYNLFSGKMADGGFATAQGLLGFQGHPQRAADPAYAIRYDRVDIRPAGAAATADEVQIEGTFIASEYTGSAVNAFFSLDDGKVFEVEAHLSHRAPENYEPHRRYALAWKREDALVFA